MLSQDPHTRNTITMCYVFAVYTIYSHSAANTCTEHDLRGGGAHKSQTQTQMLHVTLLYLRLQCVSRDDGVGSAACKGDPWWPMRRFQCDVQL